jgi:hypothetical protein
MRFAVLVLVIAGYGTADAAPAKTPCTAKAIGEVRKQAEVELRAGHAAAAVKLLESVDCWIERDQPEPLRTQIAWRFSDLAFARFKAGDFAGCYAVAAAQGSPYPGNVGMEFAEDDAVVKALNHNAELCRNADHKARGTFTPATKCTLAGDYGIPAAIAPDAACLAIGASHKDKDELLVCGKVSLVQKPPGGKLVRRALDVAGGNLNNGSVCCNISEVSFAKRGPSWAVRVHSDGRDCNGGTASSEEEHEYELSGTTLKLVHTFGATAH